MKQTETSFFVELHCRRRTSNPFVPSVPFLGSRQAV